MENPDGEGADFLQEDVILNQDEDMEADSLVWFRLDGLDTLRGFALLSMIAYHACWDMVYIFGKDWAWYRSPIASLWQQSICWTFILLSGFCFRLGRRHLRQAFYVFASGAIVTIVTTLLMPESRVWFGVLSLLGAATLLTIPMDWFFYYYVPGRVGLVMSFFLFAVTWSVPRGYISLSGELSVTLPEFLYRNNWTACLGFPPQGFASTDYFPLLPWLFLFWTGYFLFDMRPEDPPVRRIPIVTFLGRHSLFIYLIHQPILYAVLEYYCTGTIRLFANIYWTVKTFLETSLFVEIVKEYWPYARSYLEEIIQRILST